MIASQTTFRWCYLSRGTHTVIEDCKKHGTATLAILLGSRSKKSKCSLLYCPLREASRKASIPAGAHPSSSMKPLKKSVEKKTRAASLHDPVMETCKDIEEVVISECTYHISRFDTSHLLNELTDAVVGDESEGGGDGDLAETTQSTGRIANCEITGSTVKTVYDEGALPEMALENIGIPWRLFCTWLLYRTVYISSIGESQRRLGPNMWNHSEELLLLVVVPFRRYPWNGDYRIRNQNLSTKPRNWIDAGSG